MKKSCEVAADWLARLRPEPEPLAAVQEVFDCSIAWKVTPAIAVVSVVPSYAKNLPDEVATDAASEKLNLNGHCAVVGADAPREVDPPPSNE
jgi:hypothetical protein